MIHLRFVSSLFKFSTKSFFLRSVSRTSEIDKAAWYRHGLNRPILSNTEAFKRRNIFLLGPPGCGKTSVGRELARLLNKSLIDVDDHWLEPRWKCSVASKLADLGDEGFLQAEGEELLAMNVENHVVSLTGSNPLHQSSMEHLSRSGIFVYLDVSRKTILNRCEIMRVDRIVGQSTKTLADILAWREHIYEKSYDLRIIIGQNETPFDIAKKIIQQLDQHAQSYRSTRDQNQDDCAQFLDVVQQGLASDGGLYVANSFSAMSLQEIQRLVGLSYPEIALRVLERFPLGTLHPSHLRLLLWQAYSTFPKQILPIRHLRNNQYLIETFHGPTASFKDLSLQLLPLLMHAATDLTMKDQTNQNRLGLLVATSGDTGCAALDAFARLPGTPVIVLYPNQGVSIVQQAQMQTATGDVCVLGVDADFDYCQTMVKNLFNDEKFLSDVRQLIPNLHLSSANSINWARFLPQVVFAISSYVQLIEQNRIHLGDPIDICIPTGNFGNMLGAVYARRLGVPIRRLITASNENNIIADFIRTGSYDLRHRSFRKTISPSIDILISSNLERFLYLLTDGNTSMIRHLFSALNQQRHFQIDSNLLKNIQQEIQGDWADETQCLKTIRQIYSETQQLIDPHTAVAVHVADRYNHHDRVPMLISATAHYGKFPPAIFKALSLENDRSSSSSTDIGSQLNDLENLKSISPMHEKLLELPNKSIRNTTIVPAKKSAIVQEINRFLETFSRRH